MQWNPKEDGFIEKKQEIIDLAKLDKLNVTEIHRRIGGELRICCHTFRKYFNRHIVRELTKPKKRTLKRPADKQAVSPTSTRSEDARLTPVEPPVGDGEQFVNGFFIGKKP